jgi:hypothetical protein
MIGHSDPIELTDRVCLSYTILDYPIENDHVWGIVFLMKENMNPIFNDQGYVYDHEFLFSPYLMQFSYPESWIRTS